MKALTPIVIAASLAAAGTASGQFFTAPYGPGGSWNLYEVSNGTATQLAAHQAAVARQAQATGVSGVAGNATTGHLVAIGSWAENAHVALMALRHTNSSNVWIGLTDSDDAALGAGGWADAVASQTSDQWYWAGTTGGTGPNGALTLSQGGSYQAFFTGEPNNAGTAGEDAVEIRADGKWNDNAFNATGTLRRYVIEYEIGAATPVAGAVVLNPFFTARHGKTGGWNLYMISGEAETWLNAHNRAIGMTAGNTGLPSLAGSTVAGHLLEVATRAENSFAVSVMNKMLTFNFSIAANGAATNTWLGLTDTEDVSATEAAASRTTNWVWAGTSGGNGPNDYIRIEDTLDAPSANVLQLWADAATNEPNDSGGTNWPFGEDAGELRGDGRWNDLPHKIGPANNAASTIVRRFIIEWPLDQPEPVAEAEILPQYYTAQTGAGGKWNLYYLDHVSQTWQAYADRYNDTNFNPASFTGLASMSGNTTPGHLIELSDQYEHGVAYRLAVFAAAWTGLTDNETYGGQESGNASNNPTNQVQPFWVWNGTSSTNTYRRWNAGNPDDAGANEDAGEMLASGFINDNQINNINGVVRRGLVEWDINSDTPIAGATVLGPLFEGTRTLSNPPTAGVWSVKEIYDPVHGSWFTALRNANAAATNGRVAEAVSPVINFNDRNVAAGAINYPGFGDVGLFGRDLPLAGDTLAVDDNNYTRIAQTKLVITAEDDYTFNVHSDDGAALRIAGQTFTQINDLGLGFIDGASKDTIFVPYGTGDTNMRGIVHLMPGTYDLELISWEGGGGGSYEVSMARGIYLTDEAGAGRWSLVGDPAASYPAALLPSFVFAPGYEQGQWGIHTVSGVGTITTLEDAISALNNPGGSHAYGKSPVLNHSDADRPGTGGIFAGELDLPGAAAGVNDDDFAVHARGRIAIATAGQYTFCYRGTEWVAIRIAGQAWQNVSGDFGIDPADSGTISTYRNSLNNINLTEFVARAVINLPVGCHDIDVVTGDRDGAFFFEVYSRQGNFINTAEYTGAGGNNGLASPTSNEYRLVGYKGDGTLPVLGVDASGWSRRGTTPVNSGTAPGGWGGTTIATHETWLLGNGVTTDPTSRDTVNDRDPNNPTTDAGIPNGRDFWRQPQFAGTVDDNYYVEGYDAMLVVPEAGTYAIGWQGDDGGFIEVHNLPTGVQFSTRFEAMGVLTPTVANAANGTVNGRIQLSAGGGNTRTMSRLTFPNDGSVTYPATYPIKSLHFEGNGGSYWEIFAGPGNGYGRQVTLLQRDASSSTFADVDGIQLAGPDIEVLSVAWQPGPAFSFTFRSVTGVTYTIWRSDDLVSWISQGTITATGAATTYTSGPLNPTDNRFYYRATK